MKTVAVLIDFDNIFPKPINAYSSVDIQHVIDFAILTARAAIEDIGRFCIRLYGGWYENNSLTARASWVLSMFPLLNSAFPIITPPRSIIQGSTELATQLFGHSFIWYNSYREHMGIPKLRVNHNAIGSLCMTNKTNCPVEILKRFTEKKTKVCNASGCNTVHKDVFFERTQKYVDTMLACDIITLSADNDVAGIFVMSDDVDHFPAFAAARDLNMSNAKMGLLITNVQNKSNYETLLSSFAIEVTVIQ